MNEISETYNHVDKKKHFSNQEAKIQQTSLLFRNTLKKKTLSYIIYKSNDQFIVPDLQRSLYILITYLMRSRRKVKTIISK